MYPLLGELARGDARREGRTDKEWDDYFKKHPEENLQSQRLITMCMRCAADYKGTTEDEARAQALARREKSRRCKHWSEFKSSTHATTKVLDIDKYITDINAPLEEDMCIGENTTAGDRGEALAANQGISRM